MKLLPLVATAALAFPCTTLAAAPAPPSKAAAIAALKQTLHLKAWPARPTCYSPGGSMRVWHCDFTRGHAAISFRQIRGVWQTRVYVTCPAGTTVAKGCR